MQDEAHTLRSLTLFVSSHFMFNVLGKLQSEILSGEKREAVSTLTDYSKLLRQACSFGSKQTISLAEEKQFLETYLKMERARFSDKPFKYSIIGFDTEVVFIEPFIIQPFVELALLGSLGSENNTINVIFDAAQNSIRIDSVMLNMEIHEKLAEKCEVAKQRLKYFNYSFQISETENRYLQNISLNP